MTASRIAPKLYQGSLPPAGDDLARQGIRTLVLCAAELQAPDADYPGVEVLRCPYTDTESLSRADWERISRTATVVAARVRRQKRTLVTCAAGLNRSGLVTAVALTELYGCSGKEAVYWVRRAREGALFNRTFVRQLEKIPRQRAVRPLESSHPEPLIIVP